MSHYRVFLGAPSTADVQNDPKSYSWRTFSSSPFSTSYSNDASLSILRKSTNQSLGLIRRDLAQIDKISVQPQLTRSQSLIFPLSFIDAASERISRLYRDATFGEDVDDEENIKENILDSYKDMDNRGYKEQKDDQETNFSSASANFQTGFETQAQDSRVDEDEEKQVEISVFRGIGR